MYKILANTIFLGKDVHFLPECHSTNDKAVELVRLGKAQEGSIIICKHQSRGKGQRGNSWESEPGKNLTFSLILSPSFLDISEQFHLNIIVSNAIRSVLQEYLPGLKVKWPNDLVIPGRGKVGGILIENIIGGEGWEYAILGIGLNVNQVKFKNAKATSLALLTGSHFELGELLKLLVAELERFYLSLKKGRKEEARRDYQLHLHLLGEWATFKTQANQLIGMILGITEEGMLKLEDKSGRIQLFGAKEISFPEY